MNYMRFACCLLFVGSSALTGCKVTSNDIDYWRGTEKGPGKIVAVLTSPRYDTKLRAHAALSLVEMERVDVDGVAQLTKALEKVRSEDGTIASKIIDELVPQLEELLRKPLGPDEKKQGPAASQVKAMEATYGLLKQLPVDKRAPLLKAMIAWFAADFPNRELAGEVSAEQVINEFGASAAAELVGALRAEMPKESLAKIAELIGTRGNEATLAAAGKRVVEIQQEMDSKKFIDWIGDEFAKQYELQFKKKPSAEMVSTRAQYNAELFMLGGAFPAMKALGKVPVVHDRLMAIVNTKPAANAPPAEVEKTKIRRLAAIRALEGNGKEQDLDTLFAIVDQGRNLETRAEAFDRIEEIRSPKSLPRLWPMVGSAAADPVSQKMRWMAGELILSIEGDAAVARVLNALPKGDTAYLPSELRGYGSRISQTDPSAKTLQLMSALLRSPEWYKRVIAIRFFERRGGKDARAKLEKSVNDSMPTYGAEWKAINQETVGAVARDALAILAEAEKRPEKKSAEQAEGKGEAQ